MKKSVYILSLVIILPSLAFAQSDSLSVSQFQTTLDSLNNEQIEIRGQFNQFLESNEEFKENLNKKLLNVENSQSVFDSVLTSFSNQLRDVATSIDRLNQNLSRSDLRIDELQTRSSEMQQTISENNNAAEEAREELNRKLQENFQTTDTQLSSLDQTISENTVYWAVAVSVTLLIAVILFFWLRRKMQYNDKDIVQKIAATKKELGEEGLKLDQKLMDILNTQMKVLEQTEDSESGEKDHSLALKIADEVTRIRMNLDHMDKKIRGWKQLDRSARAILNNFISNGYELPELLGKDYDENMNIIATSEIDDTLKPGEQKIKRVIKPEVSYKEKIIQTAQVVVGIGN